MKSQVQFLSKKGIVDTSFIGLDFTPIAANTSQNNPKSFLSNKFKSDHQPKADNDCKLGVHTVSNQTNEKKFEFYWGYKNHVLVDCISGLPVYEMTTTANVSDSAVALDILADISTIRYIVYVWLSFKAIHYAVNSIGLVLLYFKIEFHPQHHLLLQAIPLIFAAIISCLVNIIYTEMHKYWNLPAMLVLPSHHFFHYITILLS